MRPAATTIGDGRDGRGDEESAQVGLLGDERQDETKRRGGILRTRAAHTNVSVERTAAHNHRADEAQETSVSTMHSSLKTTTKTRSHSF